MNKEPKRWQCTNEECNFLSKNCKRKKVMRAIFYVCSKCESNVVESQEWLDWHEQNRLRQIEEIKANGGYFLGRKIF